MADAAHPPAGRAGPVWLALGAALGWYALLQAVALWRAGGVFEYPLDDVYIHLAIAEQIARGSYGINAGEFTSAGSSPLYPFLLVPFAGTEAQRFMPVLWNLVGLGLGAWLWGRIVVDAGFRGLTGALLALAGPVGLNMAGVAFLGMEHSLHMAASLAVVWGLWRFLTTGQIGAALVLGMVLGPAFRLEGLALSGAAALVLVTSGRLGAGLALGAAALVPVAAFMGALMAMGLAPLPNSVMAKMVVTSHAEMSRLTATAANLSYNLSRLPGMVLGVLTLMIVPLSLGAERARGPARKLALAVVLAVAAHLLAGQVGWAHRYEHYILVALMGALVLIAGTLAVSPLAAASVVLAPALVLGVYYNRALLTDGTATPRALHLQQAQMGRLARELGAPVAVNDLGRVAWGNPNYVLDLWGLASDEALTTRLGRPPAGWAGPIAERHGVELVMIYDAWLAPAAGEAWVKLGELRLDGVPKGFLAGDSVSFYATSPEAASRLAPVIERFAVSLPAGAVFIREGSG